MRVQLGGSWIDIVERTELHGLVRERLSETAEESPPLLLASANLDHIYHFGRGSKHPRAIDRSDGSVEWLVLLDGWPVARTANLVLRRCCRRLPGSDLLPELLGISSARGPVRVGLLGSGERTRGSLPEVLAHHYPHVELAGVWSPRPNELSDPTSRRRMRDDIASAGVHFLILALGRPNEELWLSEHAGSIGGLRVAVAFGAAVDFLAGTVRRAPLVWRQLGLEWLYRLLREPGRLWRRYLLHAPVALWRLIAHSRQQPGHYIG